MYDQQIEIVQEKDKTLFYKEHADDALFKVRLHTTPILIFDGPLDNHTLVSLGTGILARIASRYFILSAGHCVRDSAGSGKVLALGVKKKAPPLRAQIANSGYCYKPNTEIDFGYWELAEYDAGDLKGNHVFISLDGIVSASPAELVSLNDWMVLAGFPGEIPPPGIRKYTAQIFAYTTILAGPSNSGIIPTRLHEEIGMLDLCVEAKGDLATTEEHAKQIDIPDLGGCSGGGVWLSGVRSERDDWKSENMRLAGIYIGNWPYEKGRRFGRAVLVGHHLNLIANHYDDLREEICKRFPRLDEFSLSGD